jgi:hypothetical protein
MQRRLGRTALKALVVRCSAVAIVALGISSGVAAAAPVEVGPGSQPRVAVDAAGNGHVTWIETVGNASRFHYCKLPAGGTACTTPFVFEDANQDVVGGYALLPGDNRVLLVEARGVSPTVQKLLWVSTDGGATFAAPTPVATMTANGAGIAGDALYVPAGTLGLGAESIFTIGYLAGQVAPFQATGTSGNTTTEADLMPNVSASLGIHEGNLVAALGDFNNLFWTRYAGPVPATPDTLNTAANWSAPALVGPRDPANTESIVASGPSGIYVGYEISGNFVVSKFTGSGWSPPATAAANASHPDLFQDPGGHLRYAWNDVTGLRYAYTTDAANTVASAPQTLDMTPGDGHAFLKLATNSAGIGWAVWTSGVSGVRAVPLAPTAPAPPPAPMPPPPYSGPKQNVKTSGFGASYTLTVPRGCVLPGQQFRATLGWKRKKRKGNLFVKVRRTDFYLGSGRVKNDSKAPFVHTYRVVVTQPRGSTITIRARAFIKVKRGKSPKKSIRARIKVCA